MADDLAKLKLQKKLAEAEKLTAPAIRVNLALTNARKQKKENETRAKEVVKSRLPGLPGNVFGFDAKEFYWFCFVILKYKDMRPQPHDEMCDFAASLVPDITFKKDKQHFGMLLVPRDTFKSVIFSVALPLYLIWKNRDIRILLSAHRHDSAKKRLSTIKWNIEFNEDYKKLVGDLKPQFKELKWAEDGIVVRGRQEAFSDLTIDTCGVDRSVVGAHPDVIICDDVHSEQNVGTSLMRAKVEDHLINMYPMLQPGGTMLIVATRWHYADAYGKLLSKDQEKIKAGQEAKYTQLIRSCYLYDDFGDKIGLYFAERLSENFLEEAKFDVGPTKFSLWYLNQPISSQDKLFPKEQLANVKIRYIFDQDLGMPTMSILAGDGISIESVPVNVTMTWDPAGHTPTSKSDFHGISVVGCDPTGRYIVPFAEAIKAKPDQVLRRIAASIAQYEPASVIIEDVGRSGLWGFLLRQHLEFAGMHCPAIILHKPSTKMSKIQRIETMQPMWARGEIIIDRSCRVLIEQLDNFPQLDYDDVIDSLQMHKDFAIPANPDSLDLLVDYEAIAFFGDKAKQVNEDSRAKIGAYAGRSGSTWGSMDTNRSL